MRKLIIIFLIALSTTFQVSGQSWTADNGDGTYTNPLFYDEFSDPDIIRVGTDFYPYRYYDALYVRTAGEKNTECIDCL